MSSTRRPPAKRLRIAQACDQCRKRKSKCDGEQPICSICRSGGRNCTYSNTTARRGLQPGYVRALESIIGLMMKHVPGSEATVQNLLRASTGKTRFPRGSAAAKGVDVWRSSGLASDLDKILQRFEAGDAEDHLSTDDDDDVILEEEPIVLPQAAGQYLSEPTQKSRYEFPAPASNTPAEANPHTLNPMALGYRQEFNLPFPGSILELVDFYFKYTHCWLPILERREVLRYIHTNSVDGNDPQITHDQANRALIWAICVYSGTSGCRIEGDHSLLNPMYIQACVEYRLSSLGEDMCTLTDIQTLLILVLLRVGRGDTEAAWVLIARAARMLLIRDASHKTTGGRWQHAFQACGFLDHFLSASLQRRPCIGPDDQTRPGRVDEDALEEWETWAGAPGLQDTPTTQSTPQGPLRSLSTFNFVDQLIRWHQEAVATRSASSVWHLISRLEEWRSNLPADRACVNAPSNNIPTLHLHLLASFFICSTIRKSTCILPPVRALTESTARSSLGIVRQYLALTDIRGSSPLLPTIIAENISCLKLLRADVRTSNESHVESQLRDILGLLNQHWCRKMAGDTRAPPSSWLIPTSNSQPGRAPEPQMTLNCTYEGSIHTAAERAAPYIYPSQDPMDSCTIDDRSDANEFDTLFEEMAASMPSARSTTSPLFAQNLGFMTNEWDSEFLSFLRYPSDR
ncbi:hypothetical protein FE257_010465 [Aspergillus nanangensis]|uniref:Zn(2)-C6 fungal-type domain-containing protein n=1 Tax=Aspergillus nanangensis TaxID=2582783 RepID=A0AAD4CIJ6_ASPNN|nr:hypothetical protein FE257_010465 [Aspergillus nanangensis]